jgi:hypothetical protein
MGKYPFVEVDPKTFVQSLFEQSSTQKQRLGTIRRLSDGREFIYGQAGGANIAVGVLCQGAVHDVANHGNIAVTNANANDTSVTVTLSDLAATANMYAEGYLHISNSTTAGKGYAYKVKSHPAANANANLVIQLYDYLRANLTTAFVTLCRHPAKALIIHPSPPTQALVGATVIPVTANYYAWFQRRGPAAVLANGTLVAGDHVAPSASVDGSVSPANSLNANSNADCPGLLEQRVGKVLTVNADGHYALIDLNLA